jgi:hypothetical protein
LGRAAAFGGGAAAAAAAAAGGLVFMGSVSESEAVCERDGKRGRGKRERKEGGSEGEKGEERGGEGRKCIYHKIVCSWPARERGTLAEERRDSIAESAPAPTADRALDSDERRRGEAAAGAGAAAARTPRPLSRLS